jgi:hypothetical protein
MKKIMIAMALLMVTGAPPAVAQGGSSSMSKNSGVPQAPVGHRQPRKGDVPDEKNITDPNDPLSKENQALDRKIKSICRGC